MLKGVIFDHDGTLVDSERGHYQLWADILSEYGIDFSETEYKRHLAGVPTQANAEYLVEHYSLPLSAQQLFARREQATRKTLGQHACPAIDGALELVEWVHRQQLKMAIATGAPAMEIQPTLDDYQLAPYFPVIATRDHVHNAKPAPDVYQYALDGLGLQANECVAIEDSPTGLASALACGVPCIVVQNDYMRGHDFAGATVVVESMSEARDWLVRTYSIVDE